MSLVPTVQQGSTTSCALRLIVVRESQKIATRNNGSADRKPSNRCREYSAIPHGAFQLDIHPIVSHARVLLGWLFRNCRETAASMAVTTPDDWARQTQSMSVESVRNPPIAWKALR